MIPGKKSVKKKDDGQDEADSGEADDEADDEEMVPRETVATIQV